MKRATYSMTLIAGLFLTLMATSLGAYLGYRLGLRAYDDLLVDEALAEIHYVSHPAECPPSEEGIKYEWFHVEPPIDNDLPEREEIPSPKKEGGCKMSP